jgi:hypothetical protein
MCDDTLPSAWKENVRWINYRGHVRGEGGDWCSGVRGSRTGLRYSISGAEKCVLASNSNCVELKGTGFKENQVCSESVPSHD